MDAARFSWTLVEVMVSQFSVGGQRSLGSWCISEGEVGYLKKKKSWVTFPRSQEWEKVSHRQSSFTPTSFNTLFPPYPNYRRQPPTTPPINPLHLSTSALPAATRDFTWDKSSCCTFRFRSNSDRAKFFSSLRVGSLFARRRVVRRIVRYRDSTWARRRKAGRERGSGRCEELLV